MTEAGAKWVSTTIHEEDPDSWQFTSSLSRHTAEFWIRALCAEVERRASVENKKLEGRQNYNDLIADAFQFLKYELLGMEESK